MEIVIPYKTMLERHPMHVDEVVANMRASKSKFRNLDPAEMEWGYAYCQRIRAANPFARRQKDTRDEEQTYLDEIASYSVMIFARPKQRRQSMFYADSAISVPKEIQDEVRAGVHEQFVERARLAALSPEERQAEIDDLLGQLRGTPGFMEVAVQIGDIHGRKQG